MFLLCHQIQVDASEPNTDELFLLNTKTKKAIFHHGSDGEWNSIDHDFTAEFFYTILKDKPYKTYNCIEDFLKEYFVEFL